MGRYVVLGAGELVEQASGKVRRPCAGRRKQGSKQDGVTHPGNVAEAPVGKGRPPFAAKPNADSRFAAKECI